MTTVALVLDGGDVVELDVDDLYSEFWIGTPADPASALTLRGLFPGRTPVRVAYGPEVGRTSGAFLARRVDGTVVLLGEESFSPARRRGSRGHRRNRVHA